jgi:enoyl-CoA hydratase/carnithine racemase
VEVQQRGEVVVETRGSLCTVTLHHPGKLNAMSRSMWRALKSAFVDLQSDPNTRCVLVRGQGGHFCAGGDIAEYPAFRFETETLRAFHEEDVWGALQAMLDCDAPIVAQIDGNCMGAGVEIAACCDIRVASDAARFGAPIARLGFPMAPREAALVLRSVGALTAREMLLSAAVLDAAEMKLRGFLNQVVAVSALGAAVQTVVDRILPLAPRATRLNKECFRALASAATAQAATDLIANAYHYAASDEHREGVTAFMEKRPPRF